jgi:hypothetical protein
MLIDSVGLGHSCLALGQSHPSLGELFQTRQSTRQLHLKKEGLNFQYQSSLAKHSRADDEVWYHGYHAYWTQRDGTGGPTMSRPTRLEDPGQEAHYRGGLKDSK